VADLLSRVAPSAVLTGPVIVSAGCRVGDGALLRGGVWAGEGVTIGPYSEIKGSLLFRRAATAHRNYVGDSIIGSDVNLEAARHPLGDSPDRIAK
jgi:UDP-N-acetylglucosamine diphosphorylase / glucose-1-phosphate thymidylyltransferase / UDP-N-acetylgalactosamine diphosphorylase / glucosamine-1-phosphate N-acetyltransferase / galactosamine-1-phosphate N-acetyltransferase